jgi:hypothetical protein
MTGGISFMRETDAFDLTSEAVATSHGCRSWMLQSAEQGMDTLDRDLYTKIVDIDMPLPVLEIIGRLLSDGLGVAQRTLDDHRANLTDEFLSFQITLEATIWFTLYTIERRIESFWDRMIVKTDAEKSEMQHKLQVKRQALVKDGRVFDILDGSGLLALEPAIACFLGLWVQVCQETDPFSSANEFQTAFIGVLDTWRDSALTCIEEPSAAIRQGLPAVDNSTLYRREEVFEWASEPPRRELIRRLLPWLQLRGIVLYYFLNCFGDSSKVATAESSSLHVQMA